METKRRWLATTAPVAILALLALVALVGVANGEPPLGDGSSSTSVSLLSVNMNGRSLDLGTGSGMSNNLPGNMGAGTNFFAARTLDLNIGQITATADAANPDTAAIDYVLPLDINSVLSGSVTYAAAEAHVDPATYWAMARLGHATIDASAMGGLVQMNNVDIGFTNESSTSASQALQGISIEELTLARMGLFLDRSTTMSSDQLILIAGALGGPQITQQLLDIEIARQLTIQTINALLPLGYLSLSSSLSVQQVLDFVASCSNDRFLLPICSALQSPTVPLLDAMSLLRTMVGALPLITIKALEVGVAATTGDASATSTVVASWGSASVAGIELTKLVDPQAAMEALMAAVEFVETQLRQLPGLEDLSIVVTPLMTSTPTNTLGSYSTARSQLDFLEISMTAPASSTVPAPMSITVDVITMSAASQYRPTPFVLASGGNKPAGDVVNPSTNNPAANSGPQAAPGAPGTPGGQQGNPSNGCSNRCPLPYTGFDLTRLLALGMLLIVMGGTILRRPCCHLPS
ncbi:MAG: hypothetical protein ABIS18_04195 [Actinomycetota bacterium]